MTETAGTAPRRWRPARRIAPPIVLALLLLLSLNAALPLAGAGAAASHSPYTAVHPDTITLPSAAASTTCASATTCNVAVRSTANSVIVVIIGQWSSDTTPSAVALHGYTDSSIGSKGTASTGEVSAYYFKNVSTAATNTVYVNYSGLTVYQITAVDVGNVTTAPLDGPGTGMTGTGTSAGATFTTTVANELEIDAIAAGATTATDAFTVAASSDTLLTATGPSSHGSGASELYAYGGGPYVIEGSAGAHNLTATLSRSTEWWALGFGLLPAAVPVAPSSLAHGTLTTTTAPLTWSNNPSSGGVGPVVNTTIYQALYSGGSCGAYSVQHSVGSAQATSYTVTGLTIGDFYCYYAVDWNTTGASSGSNVLSNVGYLSVSASLSASPTTTQVGESSVLTYSITNGAAPYTWTITRNGSTSNLTGASGGTYTTPAYTHSATYVYYFNVTDSASGSSDKTATVTVEAALAATLTAAPSKTQVGESSILSLSFSGGVAPVSWSLHKNGSSSNLSGVSGGHYTFTPVGAGTYVFYLNSSDAVGSSSKVTTTITVEAALVASFSGSPLTTQSGEAVMLSYSFAGGVTPITWTITINGSSSNRSGAGPSSYSWTPPTVHANTVYVFYLNSTDAVGSTSDKTVSVTVHPALVATLAASPATTQVGGSSYVNWTLAHGVNPVIWTLELNGSASNITGAGGGSHTFTPAGAGTYVFYFNATDAVGSTQAITATVTVKAALSDFLTATPATTQVGGTSTIALSFSGGVSPITWTLTWTPSAFNITGVVHDDYAFVPGTTGAFTFYLNASDAVGSTAKTTVVVTVVAALTATAGASHLTVTLPGNTTITYGTAHGVPPVSWTLEQIGVIGNLSGASGGMYDFIPASAGFYIFYLNATDSVGSIAKANVTITVLPAGGSLYTSLLASSYSIHVGGVSILTVVVLGGTPVVQWTLKVNGSATNISGVFLSQWTFAPVALGTYTFQLVANDSALHYSVATASVTVLPAVPPPPGPPGFSLALLLFLIPAGLLVFTFWGYSLNRRKKRPG